MRRFAGIHVFWFALLCSWSMPAAAELAFHGDDLTMIEAAGGRVVGELELVPGREHKALRLGENAYLAFPTARHLDPGKGTVSFRVRPLWDGGDGRDHAFFHLGDGNAHLTVFKTAAGSLRLVYKASPAQYAAANVNVASWKADEWHEIAAGWAPDYSGNLVLVLRVDDQQAITGGARRLDPVPDVLYVGRRGPRAQPAEAAIDEFRLTAKPPELPYASGPKEPVAATVDAASREPFRRVHDFTTIWNRRENPVPFRVGDPEYRRFVEAGFKMVRLVAFSEGWLWGVRVDRNEEGGLLTDFGDFDRLVDVFLAAGAEPYVRLAYHTPSALTDPSLPPGQRRYALPQDLDLWDELMERIVRHVRVERKLPVRYWVAALNEGDIPVRRGWAEPETIYRLYERTARLVKRIDPEAKVGGPALAWSVEPDGRPAEMLRDFLAYCRERDLPLDFVCFHGYHKAHPRDYESLIAAVRRAVEKELPERAARMEYFLDEWNVWNRDGTQDNEYGATHLAASLHYQRRAGLTKSSIVSFNHFRPATSSPRPGRAGAPAAQDLLPFVYNDATIGLYTGLPLIKGPVVTAPYFVWAMHHRLGDEQLGVELSGRDGILEDDSGGLVATASDRKIVLLAWHFDLLRNAPRDWTIQLRNLPPSFRAAEKLRVTEYRIDHDRTNPYTDYVLEGKDSQGGAYNSESGSLEQVGSRTLPGGDPTITLRTELPNMSVGLIEVELP